MTTLIEFAQSDARIRLTGQESTMQVFYKRQKRRKGAIPTCMQTAILTARWSNVVQN